jgi:hypothetical protein
MSFRRILATIAWPIRISCPALAAAAKLTILFRDGIHGAFEPARPGAVRTGHGGGERPLADDADPRAVAPPRR